jgi:hypothetical protein
MGELHQFVNPTTCDILCGAGYDTCHHKGNEMFRTILLKHFETYFRATCKKSKIEASRAILADLLESGARFLKKDGNRNRWLVADIKVGKDKISHALRSMKEEKKKKQHCQDNYSATQQSLASRYQEAYKNHSSVHDQMEVYSTAYDERRPSNESFKYQTPRASCNEVQETKKRCRQDSMPMDSRKKSTTSLISMEIDSRETKRDDWLIYNTVDTLVESNHSRFSARQSVPKSDSSYTSDIRKNRNYARRGSREFQSSKAMTGNGNFKSPSRRSKQYNCLSRIKPTDHEFELAAALAWKSAPQFPSFQEPVNASVGAYKGYDCSQDPLQFAESSRQGCHSRERASHHYSSFDDEDFDSFQPFEKRDNVESMINPLSVGVSRADTSKQEAINEFDKYAHYNYRPMLPGYEDLYSYYSYGAPTYLSNAQNYSNYYKEYPHPYVYPFCSHHPPFYPTEIKNSNTHVTNITSGEHVALDDWNGCTPRSMENQNNDFPETFSP